MLSYDAFQRIVDNACSLDTCYSGDATRWNASNPVIGHCCIVSLLAQEIYGGSILKVKYNDDGRRGTHFYNHINGQMVDFTKVQFSNNVSFTEYSIADRKKLLKPIAVRSRYEILRAKIHNDNVMAAPSLQEQIV
jgi:hypothetical protein